MNTATPPPSLLRFRWCSIEAEDYLHMTDGENADESVGR